MIKKIRLDNFSIARLSDKEPFICRVNDTLSFEFVTDKYDLRNLIVTFKNGETLRTIKAEKTIQVREELLFAGKLEIGIELIVNGQTCKKWEVIPILLKDFEKDKLEACDYISALETKLTALIKIVNLHCSNIEQLQEKHNDMLIVVNDHSERIKNLEEE